MDLQYLNGFDGDGIDELGKIIKRKMASKSKTSTTPTKKANQSKSKPVKKAGGLLKKITSKAASKPTAAASSQPSVPAVKQKKKGILKKVVSAVNKVNPATILLRNGILAAMKLNVKNVAARLRWSYLTPEQAAGKGIEPGKFQKLVATRQKLENIFNGAGGKIANLKKAILSGKGNKDKAVSGLGMLPMVEWSGYMSEYTPLDQLLGTEVYYSENVEGMEGFSGFGELGEPVTLATVGAAMGVIAGIVAALKQIGDIFKSKQKGSEDFDESKTDAPENNVDVPKTDSSSSIKIPTVSTNNIIPESGSTQNFVSNASENNIAESQDAPIKASNELPATYNRNEIVPQAESEDKLSPTTTDDNANSNADADKESFWDKNKKWLKPVAIGVGGLTLIAIGFKMFKGKEQNKSSPKSHSLSGLPRKKKKKYKKNKSKHKHKRAIALL